jgi:hypothetical protein
MVGDLYAEVMAETERILTVNTQEGVAPFKYSTFYFNRSNRDVTIIHRNGMTMSYGGNPKYARDDGYFVVRTIYYFTGTQAVQTALEDLRKYRAKNTSYHPHVEIILSALEAATENNIRHSNEVITIDDKVDVGMAKKNFRLYSMTSDLLIAEGLGNVKVSHPYSPEARAKNHVVEPMKSIPLTGVFVDLIDNEQEVSCRYMYAAKQLVEIPARQDPSRPSGVYFTYGTNVHGDEILVTPKFFSLEDAKEKLGMYPTKEETMTHGNPTLINRSEEERYKSDNLRISHEVEQLRLQNARLKEEIANKEMERNEDYDTRKKQRDEFFETRSYERKDSSELIKYGTTIILSIIGTWALLRKGS